MPTRQHPAGYVAETDAIRERRRSARARRPHDFDAAKWTAPNGHPRCRLCGITERVGGRCPGADHDGMTATNPGASSPVRPIDYPGAGGRTDATALAAAELDALELEVAELERDLDAAAGLVPPGSRRGLYPHERAARVNFARLAADVDARVQRLIARVRAERDWLGRDVARVLNDAVADLGPGVDLDRQRRALGDALYEFGNPAVPLARLFPDLPGRQGALVDGWVGELVGAVEDGWGQALDEADAQGVPVRHLRAVPLVDADGDLLDGGLHRELVQRAGHAGNHLYQSGIAAVREHASRFPIYAVGVDEAVAELGKAARETHLAAIETDAARGSVTQANGHGRQAAATALPRPRVVYASELLDGATCGPCSLVDGREYADMGEATVDYPNGTYRGCQGGIRCRGTLVFVWETEAEPTGVVPGDRPEPGAGTPGGPPRPGGDQAPPSRPVGFAERLSGIRRRRPATWAPEDASAGSVSSIEVGNELRAALGRTPTADEVFDVVAQREAQRYAAAMEHEALVREAGEVIDDEVSRRLADLPADPEVADLPALVEQQAEAEFAYIQHRDELRALTGGRAPAADDPLRGQYVAIRDRAQDASNRARDLQARINAVNERARLARARVTRDVLAEVQEMGPGGLRHRYATGSVKGKGTAQLEAALDNMPRRWVEASVRHSETEWPLYVGNIDRGHYKSWDYRRSRGQREKIARLNISGNTDASMRSTAGHEFGHRVEHVLPDIKRLEHAFYRRRTLQPNGRQEPRKWMGPGYKRDEVARPDEFVELYMGKDYGNRPESYYELLSMGIEGVFHGRWGALDGDPDMRRFILGLLTMA